MRIAALLLLSFASIALAGEPEKSSILASPPAPYVSVRVPTLSVQKDGSILCITCAGYARGDWAAGDVLQQRSTDGGKTWSKPDVLYTNPKSSINALPITTRDGAIHLLLMRDYGTIEAITSTDGGKTYSPPQDITGVLNEWKTTSGYLWTVVAPGPGSAIELQSGRLVVPLWMTDSPKREHRPSIVTTLYSDDAGKSWHVGDIVCRNTPETINPNESDIVQLPDGRVMINMRNESPQRQRLISFSGDGSTGWSKPEFAKDLFEPICEASFTVVPLPEGKHMLVHIAPHSTATTMPAAPKAASRQNLTLYASLDDGKTWPIKKTLDADRAAYSDVCVGPDGKILVAYRGPRRTKRPNGTTGIAFLSIDPAWVLAK